MIRPADPRMFDATEEPDIDRLLPLSARCDALAVVLANFENNANSKPLDISLLRRTFEHVAVALRVREKFGR